MAGHEAADAVPAWAQISAGLAFIAVTTVQVWRFMSELRKKEEPSKHVVMEAAELADMTPVRDLAKRMADTFPIVASLPPDMREILRILHDMERQAAIDKGVEDRLREERMRADIEARDRR